MYFAGIKKYNKYNDTEEKDRRYTLMTNRERELETLNFGTPQGRGSVEETFYPWVLTTNRFKEEGMPADIADGAKDITNNIVGNKENQKELYLPVEWGEGVMEYENAGGIRNCAGEIHL